MFPLSGLRGKSEHGVYVEEKKENRAAKEEEELQPVCSNVPVFSITETNETYLLKRHYSGRS